MRGGDIKELSDNVEHAYNRIKQHIYMTPLMFSQQLSKDIGADVYLKLENEQVTCSLKARGAFNKLLLLKERDSDELAKGLVTASSGNHGIACAYAAKTCGSLVEVFTRVGVSQAKLNTLLQYGAKITRFGTDCLEAETEARRYAKERGQTYISPYNDLDVMAGQGTIGYEIYEQLPDVDCVLVSVGGGGLIAGIAAYLKSKNPNIQIIGCQARNSKVMYESIKAGRIVHEESLDTLSDGTSGAVEDNSVTFPVCCKYVDDWILVDEEQIASAVFFMIDKHHKVVEGAAGVVIAALWKQQQRFKNKKIALVLCGANISSDTLKTIINNNIGK